MKLRKWLSVFLTAAIVVSALPEPGKTAYASEILENAEDGTGLEMDADSEEEQTGDLPAEATEENDIPGKPETDVPGEPMEDSEEPTLPEESEEAEEIGAGEDKKEETEILDNEEEETVQDSDKEQIEEIEEEKTEALEMMEKVDGDKEDTDTTEEKMIKEEVMEVQTLYAADDIASGEISEEYGHITWRIDANGKLTVNGKGDATTKYHIWPWGNYTAYIISAEVNVTDMTYAGSMFWDCENLQMVDLSKFDTSKITNMYRKLIEFL